MKENKATLFIKYSNLESPEAEIEFSIGDNHLSIKPNENYPPLFVDEGTHSYTFCYWFSREHTIGYGGKHTFLANESYDLNFSLDIITPKLVIAKKMVSD